MKYRDENGVFQDLYLPPTGDTLPIGSIIQFDGTTIPYAWLSCDGSSISRTIYSDLFNVIGTTYGAGDGSTTFNLPTSSGYIIKAKQTVGAVGSMATEYTTTSNAYYNAPYINNCNTYSTSETFTGKYWIDGKKIYRKVLTFTLSNTTGSFQYVTHNISNLSTAINHEMYYIYNSTSYKAPNDAITETGFGTSSFSYYNTNTYIQGKSAYVILEYTKTTN